MVINIRIKILLVKIRWQFRGQDIQPFIYTIHIIFSLFVCILKADAAMSSKISVKFFLLLHRAF